MNGSHCLRAAQVIRYNCGAVDVRWEAILNNMSRISVCKIAQVELLLQEIWVEQRN